MPEDKKNIGFIFSHPVINSANNGFETNRTAVYFNHLLARLNRTYPKYFPYASYKDYKLASAYINVPNSEKKFNYNLINNEDNLHRIRNEIKNLHIVVCFGEKSYSLAQKIKERYNHKYLIIKTRSLIHHGRHIKTETTHIRTNFNIINQYNDISAQLNGLNV